MLDPEHSEIYTGLQLPLKQAVYSALIDDDVVSELNCKVEKWKP